MDPGQEAEPASVEEIEALCNARKKAKKERDWKTADELREQLLYEMGVTVDDKANTWQCSDGRRGQLEGGRRGAVMPAFLSGGGYVDSKGVVDAKAVARAASAAAAGWGRSNTGCAAPQATASSRNAVRRSFQPPQVKRAGQALLAAPKAPRRE